MHRFQTFDWKIRHFIVVQNALQINLSHPQGVREKGND